MGRGLLPISANFERRIAAPIDDMRVEFKSDLLLPASWTADDNVVYTWLGMFALVYGDTVNNGGYLLIASDYTLEASWLQIGSSVDLSDYVTSASLFRNGLIKSELLPDITSDVIELLELASILEDVVGMVAGDKAFYTDDNKIYTYSGTAWENPQTPLVNKLYLCKFDNLTYKWNGTTLVATTSPLPYATNGQAIAGTSFSRVLSPYANRYAFNTWILNYALKSWVTDNFALKESGVVPPVSEDILLIPVAPSYTVVTETADNINVSSTAAVGTIVLNVLAADKALKISIKTGSNAVTIAGTAYNAGVVVFAVFTESTGTWSVDSTLDPIIPDYSDIKVQKRTTTAPQQMQFSYVISGLPAGGGAKGHLIFIDIPGSAFSGVYSSLVNFAGTTTYAQKIIEGTSLNIVRVNLGDVWYNQYDGYNLNTLVFDNTKKRVDSLYSGSINAASVNVSTWQSGEERPIGARKDPTTGLPVFAPNIEVVDVYSISNAYKTALETEANWIVGGIPQASWISGWGLQGMRHQNSNFLYECVVDNKWIRYPLVAILDIYAVPSTEITKLITVGNWTGIIYSGAALVGCYKGMRYISDTYVYEFYEDNLPCRTARV